MRIKTKCNTQMLQSISCRNSVLRTALRLGRCITTENVPEEESASAEDDHRRVSKSGRRFRSVVDKRELRFIFPEFLPDPDPEFRNALAEKLQRRDMLSRREKVELPEFYVGSVVAVTFSTVNASSTDKKSRFTGICIDRGGTGLRAWMTLRNVIDGEGVEFSFRLYAPTVVKVETLRLEKRLDDELYYLRDAPKEFSTFAPDMEPEILPEGTPTPVNDLVVTVNPDRKSWHFNWARLQADDRFSGIRVPEEEPLDVNDVHFKKFQNERLRRAIKLRNHKNYLGTGWLNAHYKYDILLNYREAITLEEQDAIWAEVGDKLEVRAEEMRKVAAKRAFSRPETSSAAVTGDAKAAFVHADAAETPLWWKQSLDAQIQSKAGLEKKRLKKWAAAEKMMGIKGKLFEEEVDPKKK